MGTGFQRDIEGRVDESPAPHVPGCVLNHDHFCMSRRVLPGFPEIVSLSDHDALVHQYRGDRHFTDQRRRTRECQGLLHEAGIEIVEGEHRVVG